MLTDIFGTEDGKMTTAEAIAYETGVLIPEYHARLVQNIDGIAHKAHIPKHMIWTSTKGICSPKEIAYLKKYRQQSGAGNFGMIYTGKVEADQAHLRMMAAAGCACGIISMRWS